jgi:hypothetical protein
MERMGRWVALAFAVALPAAAQQVVYPAKGQSASQQKTDEGACHTWAVEQSKYDPANPPPPPQAQTAPVTGSGARARGAAAGAAVGAITGNDTGDAAKAGAVVGASAQRSANRRAERGAAEAASSQQQAGLAAYQKARAACLEGKGYTVK